MQELAPIVKDLAIILGTAGVVTLLFQKIHQPVVLGYLVAGMIVGPFTPPHSLVSDVPNIKIIAELGVIFLMFSLGLEFSFHKLVKVGFSAIITGFLEVALMLTIGYLIGNLLGWSHYDSIFFGAALSISSTTIIIKALDELNLKRKKFAQIVFGILIVEDLLAILLLVALSTFIRNSEVLSITLLTATLKLLTVILAWFLVGYFLVPILFRRMMEFANTETLTIVSIALCLILVVVAVRFNYSTALGAFIMGSILAETPQSLRIIELIKPIRDIFGAVFFVSVGMLIDPVKILEHGFLVFVLSMVTIVGKILASGLGSYLTGQTIKNSLRIGFSMAQIGEFSFIIVSLGTVMGVISAELYAIIVAISLVTTFTTPYLIRASYYLSGQLDRQLSEKTKQKLNKYATWMYEMEPISPHKKQYVFSLVRFIINGFLVAIIFLVSSYFFAPVQLNEVTSKTIFLYSIIWFFTLVIASPFIWAMIFCHTSLSFFNLLTFFVTVIEVTILSLAFVSNWSATLIVTVIFLLWFVVAFRYIQRCYYWFEDKLTFNLGFK